MKDQTSTAWFKKCFIHIITVIRICIRFYKDRNNHVRLCACFLVQVQKTSVIVLSFLVLTTRLDEIPVLGTKFFKLAGLSSTCWSWFRIWLEARAGALVQRGSVVIQGPLITKNDSLEPPNMFLGCFFQNQNSIRAGLSEVNTSADCSLSAGQVNLCFCCCLWSDGRRADAQMRDN